MPLFTGLKAQVALPLFAVRATCSTYLLILCRFNFRHIAAASDTEKRLAEVYIRSYVVVTFQAPILPPLSLIFLINGACPAFKGFQAAYLHNQRHGYSSPGTSPLALEWFKVRGLLGRYEIAVPSSYNRSLRVPLSRKEGYQLGYNFKFASLLPIRLPAPFL